MMKLYTDAILACTLICGSAHAAPVYDQESLVRDAPKAYYNNYGQSFTAGLDGIDFVVFSLGSESSNLAHVDLFSGNGYGGVLLGTSSSRLVSNGKPLYSPFDFASRIALTVGGVYTFRIVGENRTYGFDASSGNAYAGGTAYTDAANGTAEPSYDLYFREGINTDRNPPSSSGVPEPTSWSLMILGFGVAGAALRWRVVPTAPV